MNKNTKMILTVALVGAAAYLLYMNRGKLFGSKSSTSSFAANEDMFLGANGSDCGCGCGCGCPKGCNCEKCKNK